MTQTPHPSTDVFIALGSNLGDALAHVRRAICELSQLPETQVEHCSKLYRSTPVGGPDGQSDFVNAVVCVKTRLAPELLLDHLQVLENEHDRIRDERWGPRTLDLDIILYGALCLQTPRLTVPHKSLFERDFVLQPLSDIEPDLIFPDGSTLAKRLAAVADHGAIRSEIL